MKKIVLAYSGGLDTSIILKWLQENYKAEVIAYTSDIGQEMNKPKIIRNAKRLGVKKIIIENLKINMNILESLIDFPEVQVINLGSSCIYPLNAQNPLKEDYIFSGKLEPTNSPYAMAKLSAIEIGRAMKSQYGHAVINLMPTNLYGPNDNFDINNGHVLPSLIAKFHGSLEKSEHWVVKLWGDGSPKREFLHVDDLAEACVKCMEVYDDEEHINVGTGEDVTIKELAETIVDVVGYKNHYEWDTSKPNGTPRKVLNVDKMKSLGWEPKIGLREGIESTYKWYKENV